MSTIVVILLAVLFITIVAEIMSQLGFQDIPKPSDYTVYLYHNKQRR